MTSKISEYLNLVKLILEGKDSKQVLRFTEKLDRYEENSMTVFYNDEYYYDTQNRELQACRGNSKEIRENIYWFLLIDNLQFAHYIWELDWKTGYEETIGVIKLLADKKDYQLPQINEKDFEDINALDERLKTLNILLREKNIMIIEFLINSDSYVIGLIKRENYKVIELQCKVLGNQILSS